MKHFMFWLYTMQKLSHKVI